MYFYRQQIFKPNEIILLICDKQSWDAVQYKTQLAIAVKFLYVNKTISETVEIV